MQSVWRHLKQLVMKLKMNKQKPIISEGPTGDWDYAYYKDLGWNTDQILAHNHKGGDVLKMKKAAIRAVRYLEIVGKGLN